MPSHVLYQVIMTVNGSVYFGVSFPVACFHPICFGLVIPWPLMAQRLILEKMWNERGETNNNNKKGKEGKNNNNKI